MPGDRVLEKLDTLPASPGCYVFRDAAGAPLYVGKAKSLRSRVRSYFQEGASDTRAFIPALRKHAADLETFVTVSEKEAAILENNLVKEYQPRFNVKLRDDKEYLTLRLAHDHRFPRLELVRRPHTDGARYFGPFHSATAARRTLNLVEKHFQLRTCTDRELVSRSRPCLQYQIKRCLAPCVLPVDADEYAAQARGVALFIEGRHDELVRELEQRMTAASQALEFEVAAHLRDRIRAVQLVREQQRVVAAGEGDADVLGSYREGDLVELGVVYVRAGRAVDIVSYSHARLDLPDDEVVAAFLREHYGDREALVPELVIVPTLPEGADGVAEWLGELRAEQRGLKRARVELVAPERGARRELLDLAVSNARHAFAEKRRAAEDVAGRLAKLQERLRLPTLPRRIECVDISHLAGEDTVGAVVALLDGAPDKTRYRTYKLRGVADGDDYGAIKEVLTRHFARRISSPEGASDDRPDLFVVDGGRGQLAVALAAASDLGITDLPIVGLAKERETARGEQVVDRVYLPGQKNPIQLRTTSAELYLLARARDEAHRFANRGRKVSGNARAFASLFDSVPGVGSKTRVRLLQRFGSAIGVARASDAELRAERVSAKQLAALREALASLVAEPEAPVEGEPSGDEPDRDPVVD